MERLSSMWTDSSAKYSQLFSSKDKELSRIDFPPGFRFGVATAAYQIEGAAFEAGRGLSIWDEFSHTPGKIYDGTTGDVACNHYYLYKHDIQLMKQLSVDAYRFSISWPRIFPDGTQELNPEGVSFYNSVIDHLLQAGIEPYATLYHWDLPLGLENNVNVKGWRTKEIVKHFAHYAETCFKLFGDRVKSWATFNEIRTIAVEGYGNGTKAPGRCSISSVSKAQQNMGNSSTEPYVVAQQNMGNSSTEPYVVAHNALLAHAAAVQIYRKKFQAQQKGRIGMVVDGKWFEPYTSTKQDIDAAQRCLEFEIAWILDPLFGLDYPESMRKGAGSRLPSFTDEERKNLQGSVDFIGYNYYTAYYAKNSEADIDPGQRWHETDRMATTEYSDPDGKLIGERLGPPDLGWVYNCPWALPKVLAWIEQRYGKERIAEVPILITENGTMDMEWSLPFDVACNDWKRIEYLKATLQHLANFIKEHDYNVQGYFTWSLMDNFEWNAGLACRFGLYYVDFADKERRRHSKRSAEWYHKLLVKSSSPSKVVKSKGCLGDCCWLLLGLGVLCQNAWLFHTALDNKCQQQQHPG